MVGRKLLKSDRSVDRCADDREIEPSGRADVPIAHLTFMQRCGVANRRLGVACVGSVDASTQLFERIKRAGRRRHALIDLRKYKEETIADKLEDLTPVAGERLVNRSVKTGS